MNRLLSLAVLAAAIIPWQSAAADQDPIGPFSLVFNQKIDLNFPNHVLPHPSVKVLQFVGEAINNGPGDAELAIHFDYTDAAGNSIIVPLPYFYRNVLPPSTALQRIEAGPVTLPYCPPQVSIHFELLTPGEITMQGVFDHTCIPVPEPATASLAAFACVTALARSRRRGA
jgi:hypothetical protein